MNLSFKLEGKPEKKQINTLAKKRTMWYKDKQDSMREIVPDGIRVFQEEVIFH